MWRMVECLPTCEPCTYYHCDTTAKEGDGRGPSSPKPVQTNYWAQVCWKFQRGGNHERNIEVKVKVWNVPDSCVKNKANEHPQNDGKNGDFSHVWISEQVHVGVWRPWKMLSYLSPNTRVTYLLSFISTCFLHILMASVYTWSGT